MPLPTARNWCCRVYGLIFTTRETESSCDNVLGLHILLFPFQNDVLQTDEITEARILSELTANNVGNKEQEEEETVIEPVCSLINAKTHAQERCQ